MKKTGWVLLAVAFACALLALVFLSLNSSVVASWPPPPEVWNTDNEDLCCPGDWDLVDANNGVSAGYVARTNTYAYEGDYSYQHHTDGISSLWANTGITCSVPMTQGVLDAYVVLPEDPGHGGATNYPFLAAGNGGAYSYAGGWAIKFEFFLKIAVFTCSACNPDQTYYMGTIRPGEWHNYRVEWNLPPDPGTGTLQVWMDDDLWVDESGLAMDAIPAWLPMNHAGAGPIMWHGTWGKGFDVYVDAVQIYPCDEPWPDPTPTPAPPQGTCGQYGHAAVLNVDDDCSAVLRFRAIPNEVPHDSVVTRATLHLYGVSVEQVGATINIAPLVPVWGEMTCDWCRRTVGEDWADPGATNVPLDRFPGNVAEFTAELGWVEVDIPAYIIEEWALSSAANPGLVLSNDELTGKYGIASREWIDADYRPYMVIYYTE